jgi:hypothetical protein
MHGKVFADSRNGSGLQAGSFGEMIPLLPAFKTWVSGLLLFAGRRPDRARSGDCCRLTLNHLCSGEAETAM